jgi:hypothetical protein
MWAAGYLLLLNSSEYSFASDFINSNQTIKERIGSVTFLRPGFVNFKRHKTNGYSTAKFSVILKGEKAAGVVELNLETSNNVWKVIDATLKTDSSVVQLVTLEN